MHQQYNKPVTVVDYYCKQYNKAVHSCSKNKAKLIKHWQETECENTFEEIVTSYSRMMVRNVTYKFGYLAKTILGCSPCTFKSDGMLDDVFVEGVMKLQDALRSVDSTSHCVDTYLMNYIDKYQFRMFTSKYINPVKVPDSVYKVRNKVLSGIKDGVKPIDTLKSIYTNNTVINRYMDKFFTHDDKLKPIVVSRSMDFIEGEDESVSRSTNREMMSAIAASSVVDGGVIEDHDSREFATMLSTLLQQELTEDEQQLYIDYLDNYHTVVSSKFVAEYHDSSRYKLTRIIKKMRKAVSQHEGLKHYVN